MCALAWTAQPGTRYIDVLKFYLTLACTYISSQIQDLVLLGPNYFRLGRESKRKRRRGAGGGGAGRGG